MRIAILSRDQTLWSCRRLREAAIGRGHLVDILNPLNCYISLNSARATVGYHDSTLAGYQAVIPRIGPTTTYYGLAVLRQLELTGCCALNSSLAIARAKDKLLTLQLLAQAGVAVPRSGIAHSLDDTRVLLDSLGGAPVVIKLVEGTQGVGVVLAQSRQAAESVIDAFRGLNAYILVQEYIQEAQGRDIRCLVIGDRVVAAIERQAKDGDFRSNLHRGGTARVVSITPHERATAIKAAQTVGLNVAGVDMLRAARGSLVLEVNASPGLEGIEKTTGCDLALLHIRWLEKRLADG